MIAVGGSRRASSAPAALRTSVIVSGERMTSGWIPSSRAMRRKCLSRSGSATRPCGAVRKATREWPSSARRRIASPTPAALSGYTRETPVMPSTDAFRATTGAWAQVLPEPHRLPSPDGGDGQPGEALHGHLPHQHALALRRVVRVEQQQGGPGLAGRLLGPPQHLEEEWVAEVADDQAVARGPPPAQRLGLRVGPVVDFRRGGQDPAAGILRHAWLAVQREAHRGD